MHYANDITIKQKYRPDEVFLQLQEQSSGFLTLYKNSYNTIRNTFFHHIFCVAVVTVLPSSFPPLTYCAAQPVSVCLFSAFTHTDRKMPPPTHRLHYHHLFVFLRFTAAYVRVRQGKGRLHKHLSSLTVVL